MTPNREQGQGAMDLIIQLEGKVKGKNEEIRDLKKQIANYQLNMSLKSIPFWFGTAVGVVGSLVVEVLVRGLPW